MKRYIILLLLLAMGVGSYAQTTTTTPAKKHTKYTKKKQEEIVINNNNPKTVVEIKNGKIYVDGDEVSDIKNASSEDHKIVINHKGKPHKPHAAAEARERREKEETERTERQEKREQPERAEPMERADLSEQNERKEIPEHRQHNAILGVYTSKTTPADGAYVTGVIGNSPAEAAGVRIGDIITRINETPVNNSEELVAAVGNYEPGDIVVITYSRGGATEQARATLGDKQSFNASEMPSLMFEPRDYGNNNNNNEQQYNDGNNGYGNNYGPNYNLPRHERRPVRLGISATDGRRPRGVYLEEVKPNSPAEAAGLQKGDIITRIDGERVRFAYEMQELLSYPGIGNVINIEYRHNGDRMYTTVHLERQENNQQEDRGYEEHNDNNNWRRY
jgi:membrane-associated protease RseP (regulator of RpoE activity)